MLPDELRTRRVGKFTWTYRDSPTRTGAPYRVSAPVQLKGLQRRARGNLRRHSSRALARVGALLLVDMVAYGTMRQMLHLIRLVESAGTAVGNFVREALFPGYLGGWRFALAMLIALVATGNFGRGDKRRDPTRIFLGCALAVALPLWARLWTAPLLALGQYLFTVVLLAVVLVAARLCFDALLTRITPYVERSGRVGRAVLVGPASDCAEILGRPALQPAGGLLVVGYLDTTGEGSAGSLGGVAQLDRILQQQKVDTVVMCGPTSRSLFTHVVKTAIAAECQVLSVADTLESSGVQPQIVWRRGYPFVELRAPVLRAQQLMLKRLLDVLVASFALVIAMPVMALVALAVKLDSPGPAVFGQHRLGRYGRLFRCFKFRSMYIDAEERLKKDPALYREYVRNDFKLPPDADTRITRVGRFLRKTSLDELPQLFNVLEGSMSLVGPRPIVPQEICHYDNEEPLFLSLKPGLTGEWQVSGRSALAYPHRATLEVEYVMNWSLVRDIAILLRTVPAVLFQRGAH